MGKPEGNLGVTVIAEMESEKLAVCCNPFCAANKRKVYPLFTLRSVPVNLFGGNAHIGL